MAPFLDEISRRFHGMHAPSAGLSVFIAFVILVSIVRLLQRGIGAIGRKLVLRSFFVDESAANNGMVFQMVARTPGFVGWLLVAIGFDVETSLTVNLREVHFREARLSGQTSHMIPLSQISSARVGYYRPFGLLVIAVIAVVAGIIAQLYDASPAVLAAAIVLGFVFFFAYSMSRSLFIALETVGGWYPVGFRFKPRTVGGVRVDIARVMHVTQLINFYVISAQQGSTRA